MHTNTLTYFMENWKLCRSFGHIVFGQQYISNTLGQNVRTTSIQVENFAVHYLQCGVDKSAMEFKEKSKYILNITNPIFIY